MPPDLPTGVRALTTRLFALDANIWQHHQLDPDLPFKAPEGYACELLSRLRWMIFKNPPELRFGGRDSAEPDKPAFFHYKLSDSLPIFKKGDKNLPPRTVCLYLRSEIIDHYLDSGSIVGAIQYDSYTSPLTGHNVFVQDPPEEDYDILSVRRLGNYGVVPKAYPNNTGNHTIEIPLTRDCVFPGLDLIDISSASETSVFVTSLRITDPTLASTLLPWASNVPAGLLLTSTEKSFFTGAFIPFQNAIPGLFTTDEVLFRNGGFIFLSPIPFAGENIGGRIIEGTKGSVPTLFLSNPDLLTPLSKLTKVPKLQKDPLVKYRVMLIGHHILEKRFPEGFFTYKHIADSLLAAIPKVTKDTKARYPWFRSSHDGFSEENLRLHDLYLKAQKSPLWKPLLQSDQIIPLCNQADGSFSMLPGSVERKFFLKYFGNDTDCVINSAIAEKTIYRPLWYEKLKSNPDAFNEIVNSLYKNTPFFLQMTEDPDVALTIFANIITA